MLNKLIVMLTNNDKTVSNAQEIFLQNQDLPITNWGFKDVGLVPEKMRALCESMKEAGKTTFLEVVTYTEEECLRGARLAKECGFDFLLGTLYYDSVLEYTKENHLRYCPFVGGVSGSPSILEGSLASMLIQLDDFAAKGVYGVDLLGYRYVDGDPTVLSQDFIKSAKLPVVLAGSIGSIERMELVRKMDPWCFTMGSALFADAFQKGDFRSNLVYVTEYLKGIA